MKAIVQDRLRHAATSSGSRASPTPCPARARCSSGSRAAGVDRGTWHLMTGLPLAARLALGLRRPQATARRAATWPARSWRSVTASPARGRGCRLRHGPRVVRRARRRAGDRLARRPATISRRGGRRGAGLGDDRPAGLRAGPGRRRRPGPRRSAPPAAWAPTPSSSPSTRGRGRRGVCGPAKADLVRSLGAEQVVDHTTTTTRETLDERYDASSTSAAIARCDCCARLLTQRGTLVIVGSESGGRWLGGLQRAVGAALLSPFVRQRS